MYWPYFCEEPKNTILQEAIKNIFVITAKKAWNEQSLGLIRKPFSMLLDFQLILTKLSLNAALSRYLNFLNIIWLINVLTVYELCGTVGDYKYLDIY